MTPDVLYIWFDGRKVEYRRVVAVPQKRGVKKGIELPVKYRGPAGETWAGRGMMPKWLVELRKAGRHLRDFEVKK